MYTYVKAITSNVWCRVDEDPLNYYDETAWLYRRLCNVACNTASTLGGLLLHCSSSSRLLLAGLPALQCRLLAQLPLLLADGRSLSAS